MCVCERYVQRRCSELATSERRNIGAWVTVLPRNILTRTRSLRAALVVLIQWLSRMCRLALREAKLDGNAVAHPEQDRNHAICTTPFRQELGNVDATDAVLAFFDDWVSQLPNSLSLSLASSSATFSSCAGRSQHSLPKSHNLCTGTA